MAVQYFESCEFIRNGLDTKSAMHAGVAILKHRHPGGGNRIEKS